MERTYVVGKQADWTVLEDNERLMMNMGWRNRAKEKLMYREREREKENDFTKSRGRYQRLVLHAGIISSHKRATNAL